MNPKAVEAAAKEMFTKWARIPDPRYAEIRWNRMSDLQKKQWLSDAEVAIATYLKLERTK